MNSMVNQVYSLPNMIRESLPKFDENIRQTLDHKLCLSLKRVFLTGCGDSHHASLNTELAFESLAGLPTEPMTALQFARYGAAYIPASGPMTNAVIGTSVSGEVARTVEALLMGRQAGATTISLTATPGSRVAEAGDYTVYSVISPFPDPPGIVVPGIRTYTANQLALILIAVRLGEVRGVLTSAQANAVRAELLALADALEKVLPSWDQTAQGLAHTWADAQEFVFVGSGPNFGSALFSAAKILEASGDPALGQDTEEWAHLQYFARAATTPTILISAGERDSSRIVEVAEAAHTIQRRVAAVAPASLPEITQIAEYFFSLPEGLREIISPLVTAIPANLIASYRAEVINEPYFRAFGGGRDFSGGGGISRIRTSQITSEMKP